MLDVLEKNRQQLKKDYEALIEALILLKEIHGLAENIRQLDSNNKNSSDNGFISPTMLS